MPRAKKPLTWKTTLARWVKSVGGTHPEYAHEEYAQLYELQPYATGGHVYYTTAVTTGRRTDRVKYVTDDGAEVNSAVLHRNADEARRAAAAHNVRLRRKPHHMHPLTHADVAGFRSRYRGT